MSSNGVPLELTYPVDFAWFARAVLGGNKGRLTPDGLLLIYYGPLIGWRRNPTSQAILMLGLAQIWLQTGERETFDLLLRASRALRGLAQTAASGSLAFPIMVKPLGYRLDLPWYSALSQGLSASAFCRTGALTHEPMWQEFGRRALDFVIESPLLACRDSRSGGTWFEEVPSNPPLHILNGHIFCAIGFHEVGKLRGGGKYTEFFEKGVEAVVGNLPEFCVDGLSYYDAARKTLAKPYYQRLHVDQLRFLEKVTGNPILGDYAARLERRMNEKWGPSEWRRYAESTLVNGFRVEGLTFPLKALPYLIGENGILPALLGS